MSIQLFLFAVIMLGLMATGCAVSTGEGTAEDWRAEGRRGAVVAGSREAADAGLEALKAGGNAVDAAVATLLVQSVTESELFCFGGEVPILVYDAHRGVVEVICGQGVAPRLATLEHFKNRGGIPLSGPQPAAAPGFLDAGLTALDRYGTLTFTQAVGPMLRVLDAGDQPWHADLARTIRRLVAAEAAGEGDRHRGLRLVADYFYRGPIAHEIDAWARENDCLLRASDLATHITRIEEPIAADFRGYTVYKCGPWTQGPFLLQSLGILEGVDLRAMGPGSAGYVHTVVESIKLAFEDRDACYADPLFEAVPLDRLLSKGHAEELRKRIDPGRASMEYRSPPQAALRNGKPRDTTTCLVGDRWGNVVAATPSGWSGVVAGRTGVRLGTRLQSFNTWPGHPNRIEPGKRPRITLTPTLVLKAGKPVLAISVAGGDVQDQVSLQLLLNGLEFGMTPSQSVTAPRFSTAHHIGSFGQPPPDLGNLTLDSGVPTEVVEKLRSLGHRVTQTKPPIGNPCVLVIDPAGGGYHAAGDPAAKRQAAAY